MTKDERASEIRIMNSHFCGVRDDLISYRYRLEEIHCASEAKKLDTIIGKLEALQWELAKKE